jgi:hypothetical protein
MEDSRRRRRRFMFKNDTPRSDADARNGDDDIYFLILFIQIGIRIHR